MKLIICEDHCKADAGISSHGTPYTLAKPWDGRAPQWYRRLKYRTVIAFWRILPGRRNHRWVAQVGGYDSFRGPWGLQPGDSSVSGVCTLGSKLQLACVQFPLRRDNCNWLRQTSLSSPAGRSPALLSSASISNPECSQSWGRRSRIFAKFQNASTRP